MPLIEKVDDSQFTLPLPGGKGGLPLSQTAFILRRLRTGSAVFLLIALGALATSFATQAAGSRTLLVTVAVALGTIFVALHVMAFGANFLARRRLTIVMSFLEHDSAPGFCCDEDGAVFAQNRAAMDRFGAKDGATMTHVLEPLFANPDAVVHRLRSAAQGRTSAREDVVTRRGHVRVAVHRIPGGFLWRLEDLVDRPQRAADGVGLPILTFGPSGTVLYMNEVLRTMVGRRTKRLRDLFEDVPLQNGALNRIRTPDRLERVRVVVSEPVNGRQEVFVLPANDEADGRVALDALPVALLQLDTDGGVVFANRLARDLLPNVDFGTETQLAAMVEGLGRGIREWVSEAAAGRGLYRPEIVRLTDAETDTYLQITLGRPIQQGQGGLLAVLSDATELKTMEAQFVQSQKMQAIGQLAGGVAHDFNNLLTAISGHCDLLLLRHAEGDEDFADLTQITQNANRAAALVGQLLAFSRKQTLQMQQVDLRDTLGDLGHLLNRLVGERVRLRLEHDPALLPIRGDRRQLEQVLMNLVVNARDAMPDGGEILIETRCRYLDRPMSRDRVTVPAGQFVVVDVTDQGKGISPDNLGRIFEPFFTTKRPGEGTGLGLSMAYGIVKQSGGYIFADSTPGRGTRFSLYFPADTSGDMAPVGENAAIAGLDRLPTPVGNHPPILEFPEIPANTHELEKPAARLATDIPDAELVDVDIADPQEKDLGLRQTAEVTEADMEEVADQGAEKAISAALAAVSKSNVALDGADKATEEASKPILPQENKGEAVETREAQGLSTQSFPEIANDDRKDQEREQLGNEAGQAMGDKDRPVVLLVEDEAPVRAFASRALRLRGYSVIEAGSAEEALEELSDKSLEVDLFVTDVMMPGLDGPSWVRQAQEVRPDVRTIFMSGYTQDTLSDHKIPVPNAVFLPKPFSLNDLTRTVEKVLA